MPEPNPALEYSEAVIAGDLVTGELVRLACERHLRDLDEGHRRGLRFDVSDGNRIIEFFGFLHHFKGRWARGGCTCGEGPNDEGFEACPTRIRLELWQKFTLASVFGWKTFDDEIGRWVRRFTVSYEQVARKNAKTTKAAGVALYMLGWDDEPGAEIYSAATKKDQARISHHVARMMVRKSPELSQVIGGAWTKTGSLYIEETNASFIPLSSDEEGLDGLNPHCAVIDELHAHKTADVFSALETAVGAREQALLYLITTAGKLFPGSICKAQRDYGEQMLRQEIEDDSFFAYIAELDEGDDWQDPANAIKANPNLGVSVTMRYLLSKLKKAQASPVERVAHRMKRLNQWVEDWIGQLIPFPAWHECAGRFSLEKLRGRECWAGVDLSSRRDMTAAALLFPPVGKREKWKLRVFYWVPRAIIEEVREAGQHAPPDKKAILDWVQRGWIEATPGRTVDFGAVLARFRELRELYSIAAIGVDPWNATQFTNDLIADGFVTVEVAQRLRNLSAPTKDFIDLVVERQILHAGNPVLTWNARNAKGRLDENLNISPAKKRSGGETGKRIDGICATITAQLLATAEEAEEPSQYAGPDGEDLLVVKAG